MDYLHTICPRDYVVTLGVEIRINSRRSLSPDVLIVNRPAAVRRPSLSITTHRLDLDAEVFVGTGTHDEVLRLEEPFPVSIPIASLISPSED